MRCSACFSYSSRTSLPVAQPGSVATPWGWHGARAARAADAVLGVLLVQLQDQLAGGPAGLGGRPVAVAQLADPVQRPVVGQVGVADRLPDGVQHGDLAP